MTQHTQTRLITKRSSIIERAVAESCQEAVARILIGSDVSSVGYCPEIVLVRLVVRATSWEAYGVTYIIKHSLVASYSTVRQNWTTYNERPNMLLGPKSHRLGFWPVYKVYSLIPPSRKFEVAKFKVRPSWTTHEIVSKLVFIDIWSLEIMDHGLRQAELCRWVGLFPESLEIFKKNMVLTPWLFLRLAVAYGIAWGFWAACEPLWSIRTSLKAVRLMGFQKLPKYWTLGLENLQPVETTIDNERLWFMSNSACSDVRRFWSFFKPDWPSWWVDPPGQKVLKFWDVGCQFLCNALAWHLKIWKSVKQFIRILGRQSDEWLFPKNSLVDFSSRNWSRIQLCTRILLF